MDAKKRALDTPETAATKAQRTDDVEHDWRQCSVCNKNYDCASYRNKASTLCGSCRSVANGRSCCTSCHRWFTRPQRNGRYSTVPAHFKFCYRCRSRGSAATDDA